MGLKAASPNAFGDSKASPNATFASINVPD